MSNTTDIEQIYRQYFRDVYRFLYSLCGNCDLSEELTQETFLRAITSIKRFRGICSIKSWLFQIARHCLYQQWDKERIRRASISKLQETLHITDGPSLYEEYIARENREHMYRSILTLPQTAREVLMMRIGGELSFREIGEVLGKSENWARVTFFRAKQQLIREIDPRSTSDDLHGKR